MDSSDENVAIPVIDRRGEEFSGTRFPEDFFVYVDEEPGYYEFDRGTIELRPTPGSDNQLLAYWIETDNPEHDGAERWTGERWWKQERVRRQIEREIAERSHGGKLVLPESSPSQWAEMYLTVNHTSVLGYGVTIRTLVWWQGSFWEFDRAKRQYVAVESETMRHRAFRFLERAVCRYTSKDRRVSHAAFDPEPSQARKLVEALAAKCDREMDHASRFWLHPTYRKDMGDPTEMLVFEDRAARVNNWLGEARAARHRGIVWVRDESLFCTEALPYPYPGDDDGSYEQPRPQFVAWLEDRFGHDPGQIEVVQEWFGLCLTNDTQFHKALYVHGPARSGKSTLARLLSKLVGEYNTATPTLRSLTQQFGLSPLVGKPLAIMADAKFTVRDQSVATERLKSIVGEDTIQIERKYRDPQSVRLSTRFVLISNDQLDLRDDSAALAKRMLCLTIPRTFYGSEDPTIELKLEREMPSILIWAIRGLARLRSRGRFVETSLMKAARSEAEEAGSPLRGFVESRLSVTDDHDPRRAPTSRDVYDDYCEWCVDAGVDRKAIYHFVRELMVAEPRIRKTRQTSGERLYLLTGISLLNPSSDARVGRL